MRRSFIVLAMIALALVAMATPTAGNPAQGKAAELKAILYGPLDYQPVDSEIGFQMRYGPTEYTGGFHCIRPVSGASFRLAFDLPDGAQLRKVTVGYGDTNPTKALRFEVWDKNAGDSGQGIHGMAASSVTATDLAYLDLVPASPVIVDNANHRYWLAASFEQCDDLLAEVDSGLSLGEVRVEYAIR